MTLTEILSQCSNIVLIVLSVSSILVVIYWMRLPCIFKLFGSFIIMNFLTEVIAWALEQNGFTNNLPLLHIYTLGEFIILALFYRKIFNEKAKSNLLIIFISIVIILLSLFWQNIYTFNSYSKTLVQLIIVILATAYFYLSTNLVEKKSESTKSLQLLNSAILIYYAGSLFIFMFSNYLSMYKNNTHLSFWIFNALLNLIFQILVLIAIWQVTRNKKSLS